MEYPLFIWLTFVMFVRPWELIPELESLYLYYWSILACLLAALPKLLKVPSMLGRDPITTCVIGFWISVILSHLSPWHFSAFYARDKGFEFLKTVLFYLLVLLVLDVPKRFRNYLDFLSFCAIIVVGMSVADYLEYYDFFGITHVNESMHGPDGGLITIIRMCGPGVFADPNDLSVLIMLGMNLAVFNILTPGRPMRRLAGLAQWAFLAWAYTFTQSRGGFLMIVASFTALILSRMPTRLAAPLLVIAIPAFAVVFGGRATSIDTATGSGQSRIQLWSDSMFLFRGSPLTGIGHGLIRDELPQVTHNSYLHTFTETGLIGGAFFLGIWVFAIRGLRMARPKMSIPAGAEPRLAAYQPYIFSVICGQMVGMITLSRNDVLPTYLFAGLAAAYCNLIRQQTGIEQGRPRRGYIQALAIASVACLILIQLMIKFNVVR
jgi:O-antigen ligase